MFYPEKNLIFQYDMRARLSTLFLKNVNALNPKNFFNLLHELNDHSKYFQISFTENFHISNHA